MVHCSNSAQSSPSVSDERLRNALRREIHRFISVDREMTRGQLAESSGVTTHQIDQILSRDPAKQRRVTLEDAFSLAVTMGDRAVNALLFTIGYIGRVADGAEAHQPMQIAANAMGHLAVIARNAADNRIDHTEEQETTEAADMLIAEVLPLSSRGKLVG